MANDAGAENLPDRHLLRLYVGHNAIHGFAVFFRGAAMTIDENHPSIQRLAQRLAEKLAAKRVRAFTDDFLNLVNETSGEPPFGCLGIPDHDDPVAVARFEGWIEGMRQGHQALLLRLRYIARQHSEPER